MQLALARGIQSNIVAVSADLCGAQRILAAPDEHGAHWVGRCRRVFRVLSAAACDTELAGAINTEGYVVAIGGEADLTVLAHAKCHDTNIAARMNGILGFA